MCRLLDRSHRGSRRHQDPARLTKITGAPHSGRFESAQLLRRCPPQQNKAHELRDRRALRYVTARKPNPAIVAPTAIVGAPPKAFPPIHTTTRPDAFHTGIPGANSHRSNGIRCACTNERGSCLASAQHQSCTSHRNHLPASSRRNLVGTAIVRTSG